MAAFIAKQVVGDKLSSVKGAIGKDEDGGSSGKNDEEAAEIEEARREREDKRKEKHRKMEEERESMRQGIRDKYGLKKKEERQEEEADLMTEGRVGRKKKTPAELAAEAHKDDSDEEEFTIPMTNRNGLVRVEEKVFSSSDTEQLCLVHIT